MQYNEIANRWSINVVYVSLTWGYVWHVKTCHVPHIGHRIQLGRSTYIVDNVIWNPQLDALTATLDENLRKTIDFNADCMIFLSQ